MASLPTVQNVASEPTKPVIQSSRKKKQSHRSEGTSICCSKCHCHITFCPCCGESLPLIPPPSAEDNRRAPQVGLGFSLFSTNLEQHQQQQTLPSMESVVVRSLWESLAPCQKEAFEQQVKLPSDRPTTSAQLPLRGSLSS